jgi:hypothetical protein
MLTYICCLWEWLNLMLSTLEQTGGSNRCNGDRGLLLVSEVVWPFWLIKWLTACPAQCFSGCVLGGFPWTSFITKSLYWRIEASANCLENCTRNLDETYQMILQNKEKDRISLLFLSTSTSTSSSMLSLVVSSWSSSVICWHSRGEKDFEWERLGIAIGLVKLLTCPTVPHRSHSRSGMGWIWGTSYLTKWWGQVHHAHQPTEYIYWNVDVFCIYIYISPSWDFCSILSLNFSFFELKFNDSKQNKRN